MSSVKAIIGHTKAAAGVAGLIKATMALDAQILPPTVGCDDPREELNGDASSLRALKQAECFSPGASLRAGVSAMGFGGINTHVTLEAPCEDRRQTLNSKECTLLTTAQDAELFLFSAQTVDQLEQQIERVIGYAERLSRSELTDLAVRLSEMLRPLRVRAAVVASSAAELSARLEALKSHALRGAARSIDPHGGVFFGVDSSSARIGFLFPGQGSPSYRDGGLWARRFNFLEDLYAYTKQVWHGDGVSTDVAQPAIVTSSVAALRVLSRLGITATVGVGHSLGEFTALHWAGSLDESALLRITRARGRAMAEVEGPEGAMLSVAADRQAVEKILNGQRLVIAGLNSPVQTVLSGAAVEISAFARRAEARGLRTTLLRVSHAFHSPLVTSAGNRLSAHLEQEEFGPVQRHIFSTVTGQHLNGNTDFRALLREQVTSPVRFMEAVNAAGEAGVDLWLEVGPGQTLCGLIGQFRNEPAVALDAGGSSVRGLLHAVAACFCLSARVAKDELFADRFARPFNLDWRPHFFVNPCELAPRDDASDDMASATDDAAFEDLSKTHAPREVRVESQTHTPLELVRQLVAERIELPLATIENESKLLDDLHLNSISVAQLVAEAARRLDLPPPPAPTNYANATLSELSSALEAAARTGTNRHSGADINPPGVDEWVREFSIEYVERALPRRESSHNAPKVRSEGSQGQVRSEAQHAAPGNQASDDQPGTGDRHAASTHSVGPSGLNRSPLLIEGQRAFALAPGYLHTAPPARLCADAQDRPSENPRNRSSKNAPGHLSGILQNENPTEAGDWRVFAPPDHPLHAPVHRSFALSRVGRGVVVLLPPEPNESHVGLLLDGAHAALKGGDDFRFVMVQHSGHEDGSRYGAGAASFARTLHLEANNLNTCVIDVPFEHPDAATWIVAEALAARGYTEARYTAEGKRYEPVLRPLELEPLESFEPLESLESIESIGPQAPEANACELPLTANDVLVVTGGARGITAECALRLARDSGARLAIFGLSQPTVDDDEIVSNLARMKAAGINFRYYSVDVTDADATRAAVCEVEKDLGPVTAILHGAARNVPCLIENLDAEAFSETLAPKIRGAQNLLAAIDADRLRLFVTFSSIIARTGLPGEAHYGLANQWLTRLTEQWQTAHPHCRCLAIEWSVWSGVGMGARLGTVDELARQGITP
ncbi:MAG TPA: SDR family NAD(P)-dependent oxidoreductase, partial [Pyrinomonadaceae bacterium]